MRNAVDHPIPRAQHVITLHVARSPTDSLSSAFADVRTISQAFIESQG